MLEIGSMGPALFLAMLLLIISQALLLLPLAVVAAAAACPQSSFQCGNFSLKFPFTNLSQYNCGLCMLECTHKPRPKIALEYPPEQWLTAKSFGNSTMTLHSQYLQNLLDNRSCDFFYYKFNLPNSPSISFTLLNNITLFRCKNSSDDNDPNRKLIDESFREFGYYGGCKDLIFYNKHPNSSPPPTAGSVGPVCTAVHLPKNIKTERLFSDDDDNVRPEVVVFGLLGAELDVEWRLSDDCYDCHYRRGGVCQTDQWSRETRCFNPENSGNTGAVAGGMGLLTIFLLLLYKFKSSSSDMSTLISRMKPTKGRDLEAFTRQYGSLAPKFYPYSVIKKMTNSFKDELGKGGYGTVYKGKLLDGRLVAVKILNSAKGNDEDFVNEVLSISTTSHVNVVKLLGFCIRGKKRALVYEYMPNGSLEKYIHAQKDCNIYRQLAMDKLYEISIGVARGLEYLHRGCNTRILHFDIKPHNILLDEDFCPKISDFGLAKQCTSNKDSAVSISDARGTIGYIAPELISRCFGVVSYKSDVYSYGMMILEIVGRRKNVNLETSQISEIFFPRWAYQHMIVHKDLQLKGVVSSEEEDEIAKKIVLVGLWCIQKDPSQRPTMSKVIEMLEGNLRALEIPPKPFFDCPDSASPQSSFTYNVSELSTSGTPLINT